MGAEKNQPFRIRINASNEKMAKEKLYSRFNKHKCRRHLVKIHKMEIENDKKTK